MSETREQIDEALNRLEDSIPDLMQRRHAAEVAEEVRKAAMAIETKLGDQDRRHYEGRVKLILWNAGIFSDIS